IPDVHYCPSHSLPQIAEGLLVVPTLALELRVVGARVDLLGEVLRLDWLAALLEGALLPDGDGRLALGQGAGHATLQQVLVLVEVDVEVVEASDLATTVGADGVVAHVDQDTLQAGDRGRRAHGVRIQDVQGLDVGDTQSSLQSVEVCVQTTAQLILLQEHLGDEVLGGVEGQVARSLVVALGANDGLNHLLSRDVALNSDLVGEEAVIGRDRTDLGLVDLVLVLDVAAIANQDRASDLLVEHDAHLSPQPGNDVHGGDVDDVIAVELLLLVDGGRGGLALCQPEELLL